MKAMRSAILFSLLVISTASALDSLNMRCVGGYQYDLRESYYVALDSARNLAFVGCYGAVYALDVSNPVSPAELSRVWVGDRVYGICYQSGIVYAAGFGAGLRIFSFSDPAHPVELGHYDAPNRITGVAASGDYAYTVDQSAMLRVISVADPAHPVEVGSDSLLSQPYGLVVVGDLVYVAAGNSGLRVVSVADHTHPTEVGSCVTSDARDVTVDGAFAYVADGDSDLRVLSIADSSNLVELGHCDTLGSAYGVAVKGNYVYVANMDTQGLQVISVADPAHPVELGRFPNPSRDFRHVAVLNGYAYVGDYNTELAVVAVADPAHPALAASYVSNRKPNGVAVYRDHAYVACYDSVGLSIVSLSDTAQPREVASCGFPGLGYGVALCGGGKYAYIADGAGGLRVVSITDLAHPHEVAFVNTFYANAVTLSGDYACVADDTAGLRIISIANPTNPVEVGHWHYSSPGKAYGLAVSGSLVFLASGGGGVRIVSVADPAHPVEVGHDSVPGKAYGVAVRGGYACVAGDSGLRVISVSDPTHPTEVGHCDSVGPASSVAMSRDYAYVIASGLSVVSIADPANPGEVGYYARFYGGMRTSSDVALGGGYAYVADFSAVRILRFYGGPADQLGDLDVDPDSLDVATDTLKLSGSGSYARGACVLVNTSTCYNPDPKDGPSLSSVGSLRVTGSLTGPGGALDSILIPNLPDSLLQGQTAVCTLTVHVPSGMQDGDYAGSITIAGKDVNNVPVDVTFNALVRVNRPVGPLGDLDVDPDSLGVVRDTMNLHTNPAGPNYSSTIKAEFMLVNTYSAYNPDKSDGPSRSPLRGVKVETRMGTAKDAKSAKVRAQAGTTDSIYVLNLPESLAIGQVVQCTLALAIPAGESLDSHSGWVVVSAMDTIGYQVQDSFFLKVTGPEPWKNLDSFRVAPIPFKPHQNPAHDAIHFWGLPAGARVTVYDNSGQSVWSAVEHGDGHLEWDAKVASGIYVYLVVTADGKSSKVGKLSVIR